ncbi:radical SAM protein [Streptomyces sp. NBC_01465]|uniref:radical SAM protein n=1 Tax=Streptomyces sp. NBC_01465 TaxID=2903878 RepID=UPI002E2ED5BB|nr:radical SAM protein [Streptomyces sp. NBC_01465]
MKLISRFRPTPSPAAVAAPTAPGTRGFVHSLLFDARDTERGALMSLRLAGDSVRCPYAEHPETWFRSTSCRLTSADLHDYALPHLQHLREGRGMEITGGEPLTQPEFTSELLTTFATSGIRTTLRTSGHAPADLDLSLLDAADEVILDLHACDERTSWALHHRRATPALTFARRATAHGTPLRISYALIPGVTDTEAPLTAATELFKELACPVDLHPSTRLAPAALAETRARFEQAGLKVAA